MTTAQTAIELQLKNILYLTDFSEPSEKALPFAIAVARKYGATVHALHILAPSIARSWPKALQTEDDLAEVEMQRVQSQLVGVEHETLIAQGREIWPAISQAITGENIDLIVVGTHGRTGAEKLLLGSVAEEIFRRSSVPVLTIGPDVRTSTHVPQFQRVLFTTNFAPQSASAAMYAASLAHENRARLILLHVLRQRRPGKPAEENQFEMSVAEAIHHLYESVPDVAELGLMREVAVEFGDPGSRIVEVAHQRGADLIVMAVRASEHLAATTHLDRGIAYRVAARAACPVLTVRSQQTM